MDARLKDYMARNRVCSDRLFPDWEAFLSLLFECGERVEGIVWFEYVPVAEQKHSLGGGGWPDKANPGWMWAETPMREWNLAKKSYVELMSLIRRTTEEHTSHMLVPSFFLTE